MSRAQTRRTVRGRPALSTSGLRLLLDADSISGIADGAAIATWSDTSGNANHATQATSGQRPTYALTGCQGRPAVRFSGSQWLDSPAANATAPVTVIMVIKTADANAQQFFYGASEGTGGLGIAASSTHSGGLACAKSGGSALWAYGALGGNALAGTSPWSVIAYTVDASGNYTWMIDGAVSRTGTSSLAFPYTSGRTVRVGGDFGVTTTGLNGWLAYVAIYDRTMTSTQLAAEDAALRARYGLAAPLKGLLQIPAPTITQTVTHPDVQYFPAGWNGYTYWMAMTPFPANSDENPHVLASNDGDTWTTPPGLTNPVVSQAQAAAAGYSYNSDTELLLVGSTMEMYSRYAGAGKEGITRCTSTDGVNWSAPSLVITANTAATILSPSLYLAADGFTRTMWTINNSTNKIERRTSTDGATWSAPTVCTVTGIGSTVLWHMNVVYDSGTFHCLLATNGASLTGPYRLKYLTSTDGLTWTGDSTYAVPLSGTAWDAGGHYRSSMLPLGGGLWDVWVSQMNYDGNGGQGDWHIRRQQIKLPRVA